MAGRQAGRAPAEPARESQGGAGLDLPDDASLLTWRAKRGERLLNAQPKGKSGSGWTLAGERSVRPGVIRCGWNAEPSRAD